MKFSSSNMKTKIYSYFCSVVIIYDNCKGIILLKCENISENDGIPSIHKKKCIYFCGEFFKKVFNIVKISNFK